MPRTQTGNEFDIDLEELQRGDPYHFAMVLKWYSLRSLYFFSKVVFRYSLLSQGLHLPLCNTLQQRLNKLVIELPRGHFKTTCASKSLPTWRALPMEDEVVDYALLRRWTDEAEVARLRLVHDPNVRVLLISSTETNAKKILRSTRTQFESNALFRGLWPALLPDEKCRWTDNELEVKRDKKYSESTIEAIGVGSALQSRHYDLIIEDDLVGLEAKDSETVMRGVIDYHVLLEGAFDSPDTGENLVIGNRWAFSDLNSWIKKNEDDFTFITRSAIEDGKPIFPERFTLGGLARIRKKQGDYNYSCQYLNNPIAPGAHDFEPEWLRGITIQVERSAIGKERQVYVRDDGKRRYLEQLNRFLLIDPAREGKRGKARHAIIAVGVDSDDDHWLLRTWAERSTTDRMLEKAFELYAYYKCQKCGIEGYGGDEHLKNYMNYKKRAEQKSMNIVVFRKSTDRSKEERIRATQPRFERRSVALIDSDTEFRNEYISFPSGETVDLLDAYSHADEVCRRPVAEDEYNELRKRVLRLEDSVGQRTGY